MMTNSMTQTPDQDAIDAIETELDRYQAHTTWQTALANAQAWGDEIARDSKLDAIEAELRRVAIRLDWLADRRAEVQYSDGAQDCDRAVRRATAIEAEIDRVQARQAELESLRVAAEDAADDWPDANYDPADEAL